jgi:alpha-methylacyl-CoA racemase
VADSAGGGMHAVIAILAALVRRGVTGMGEYLDVSAAEGVLSLMSLSIDQYLASGEVAGPRQTLLTGRYACYDLYQAGDGKWLSVGAIEPRFYANLCKALGVQEHIPHQMNDARQNEIRAAFRAAFATRDRDDWVAELAPADTCVAPVYSIPELTRDPHFRERHIFMEAEHATRGTFEQVGPLLAGGDREQPLHRVAPESSTDTAELLSELDMTEQEIDRLRTEGVVE